jgi:hypothetical protein
MTLPIWKHSTLLLKKMAWQSKAMSSTYRFYFESVVGRLIQGGFAVMDFFIYVECESPINI